MSLVQITGIRSGRGLLPNQHILYHDAKSFDKSFNRSVALIMLSFNYIRYRTPKG